MDCRATSPLKFRTRLGFKQYDVILTKEQSVLTKLMSTFEEENMHLQYKVFSFKVLKFHDYKLAIEIDENRHGDRNIDYEIKRQKTIKKELGCKFIRIDSDKEDLLKAINEIF